VRAKFFPKKTKFAQKIEKTVNNCLQNAMDLVFLLILIILGFIEVFMVTPIK